MKPDCETPYEPSFAVTVHYEPVTGGRNNIELSGEYETIGEIVGQTLALVPADATIHRLEAVAIQH